jgi:hypothetical protein
MALDKRAKNILFKTYWNSKGWNRKDRNPSPEDFEYAKSKGLMFDPLSISHDECVKRIRDVFERTPKRKAAAAFLCSLSTRRLDWRSAIASYASADRLPLHIFSPYESGHFYENGEITHTVYSCKTCFEMNYVSEETYVNKDLNVLNFERIKWGGARHGDLIYTLFDLTVFQNEDIPEPLPEDKAILKDIFAVIAASEAKDRSGKLRERLAGILPSTKNERSVLLEILACAGILKPLSYDRARMGRNDWSNALEYWRGEDKYDARTARDHFAEWL